MPDPSTSIGQLIRQAYLLNRATTDEALRVHGISVAQYGVLRRLADAPGSSGADLARDMSITPQAMHELISGLEATGLVERRADPAHRRIRRAVLTPLGEQTLAACLPEMRALERHRVRYLAADERRQLQHLLRKYMDGMDGGNGAPEDAEAPPVRRRHAGGTPGGRRRPAR